MRVRERVNGCFIARLHLSLAFFLLMGADLLSPRWLLSGFCILISISLFPIHRCALPWGCAQLYMAVSTDSKGSRLGPYLKLSLTWLLNFHQSYNDACKFTTASWYNFRHMWSRLQKCNKYLNTLSQKSTLRNMYY